MAAPTLSSSSESYDVFISFRGEDTRRSFTDHLYSTLKRHEIHTFRDNEELRTGENISTELLNATQKSKISIVVFSKGYASSMWCLDELVEIMHPKKTKDLILLLIFYHVDPSDVRKQTRTFAKAFGRNEKRFQTDIERVQKWREALTEAGNCSGWDLANGYYATHACTFSCISFYFLFLSFSFILNFRLQVIKLKLS